MKITTVSLGASVARQLLENRLADEVAMSSLLAAAVALLITAWLVRRLVRLLFGGPTARAYPWVRPKDPSRMDIAMSELGEEVVRWRFARVALLVVVVPVCLVSTFLVARGLLLAAF